MNANEVENLGHKIKCSPKEKFTKDDDERLMKIISERGSINWIIISEVMGNKNARQCKERYEYYLSPNINRRPFTREEDLMLIQQYQLHGPKWIPISLHFQRRTDSQLKNRFHKLKRTFNKMDKYFEVFSNIPIHTAPQDVIETPQVSVIVNSVEETPQSENMFNFGDYFNDYQDDFDIDNWH
jgi:hypothetical protein